MQDNTAQRPVRVLFVCSANMDRSPTAENFCNKICGFQAKSAGTATYARNRITQDLIEWADTIIAMEEKHKETVIEMFPESRNKIKVLNIPDIYHYEQPELINILQKELQFLFYKF
jgi:predicted protein tyrosine phosphatase